MKTAEHYVKVYVESFLVAAQNSELAVLGRSIMGMIHDFRGEIPRGSGYTPETISAKADRLRTLHPDYVRAIALVGQLTPVEYVACVEWAYHCDRRPPGYDGRQITQKCIAAHLGRDYERWSQAIRRGHQRIEALIFECA